MHSIIKSKSDKDYGFNVGSPQPIWLYALLVLVIASLVIGVYSLVGINELKNKLIPKTIETKDFLGKLTAHAELGSYKNITPLNVIQINQQNLVQLQQQVSGLNMDHVGKFLIQYPDAIILYDYDKNVIEGQIMVQPQLQEQKTT